MEDLLRQRALMQEHLRWLESEIAAESRTGARASSPQAAMSVAVGGGTSSASMPAASEPVELSEPNVRGIHSDVRNGCLLYFALACAAVGLIVAFIYWRY